MINRFKITWAACLIYFVAPLVQAQIGIDVSLERTEYLLYEPVKIQVEITNYLSESLDMVSMSGEKPWLNFYVATPEGEEIKQAEQTFKPPEMTLLPKQTKSVSINLLPRFLIRDPGEYLVKARITHRDREASSRTVKFSVVKGITTWQRRYVIPANFRDSTSEDNARLYSLLVHRVNELPILYARIISPQEDRVYCTTSLGNMVDQCDPKIWIDFKGNLHVFHQSGVHVFNYTCISNSGKQLSSRLFSDIVTVPKMATNNNDETEIIGGEELFNNLDGTQAVVPTAPLWVPRQ